MIPDEAGSPRRAPYFKILLTFARNSLVRDLSFRTNFVLQAVSSLAWTLMNLLFFQIIFLQASSIGAGTGWNKYEFYVFLATVWIISSLVQTFFMPNAEEFSELLRTSNLDFAILKPIDTQFIVSFPRFNWPSLTNFFAGIALLSYGIWRLATQDQNPLVLTPWALILYPFFIVCGVAIMYSLVIALSSTSVWLGRNQSIYMFYFYVTQFFRYPMEIYQRSILGWGLWAVFTFVVPVLVVANVPARLVARPLRPEAPIWELAFMAFTLVATAGSLYASRWVFHRALVSYRSASS